ncbi:MAG: hypothetical protein GYB41_09600 [Oceanospirillales bacterium]|uniref:Uncharacterized protein n=1 Tax=Marinobacterium halophilum TaxID=267374 RepID=A0A2P8EYX1_9GAMM|nr:hypothetical protein [Marinobacterium halophilum]MBR9828884.1 hypothetical protein [Oceanospirillales bacterium]PSL14669.1 hypothetical protein CLV44_107120 [Marinobacterium halophilum]
MPDSHITALLERLEQHSRQQTHLQTVTLPINREDMVRLQALAEVYGMDIVELTPILLHTILTDIEAHMPYKQGTRVIRVEDDEPVYEDIGPMPRYLEAKRKHEKVCA